MIIFFFIIKEDYWGLYKVHFEPVLFLFVSTRPLPFFRRIYQTCFYGIVMNILNCFFEVVFISNKSIPIIALPGLPWDRGLPEAV